MSVMNAVRIHSYGGTEVLKYETAPRPQPGPDEVLIRILATSVNPLDCALRAGYMASFLPLQFPSILGTDISGVVESVGAGVKAFKPGDSVYARGGVIRDGTYAEYATVPASDVAIRPHALGPLEAAALPHVTLTAWQALYEMAQLQSGQTVLIHGAAGGVGHIATQLAKARGAHVIGTTSAHGQFLHDLKVDEVIDYTKTPFDQAVKDVDVVLDTVGGDVQERSWKLIKPGGMLVSIVQAPSPDTAAAHNVRQGMVMSAPPIGSTLTELANLVETHKVRPHISAVLPLEQVAQAHAMVEGRHTLGKIVLQVMD